ncbi:DUF4058 family protein [Lyngbya confervoides]|uniref:DUF4058 family protein n=1 Tax=Lyngbya confervoides BDU141951 TaxID=1574623 RepID=A0ABD4T845_9CYAN|nr:DUF4058 family protein [Lyngbya confervoides]MCM1984757.1 DUF4058 family protein [Lyngbya confervoides BDU141951]
MPSPFPGMDPYLEGYLWPDVHSALANKIRQQLTPLLRPKYTARLEVYLAEAPFPEGEIGILYPAQIVTHHSLSPQVRREGRGVRTAVLEPPTCRLTRVEIRDTAQNRLVTSIEILSPVNKREPGLTRYRQKRQRLYQANVHLLEMDLLRRGTRPFAQPRLPAVPYCIALTRAQAKQIEFWPLELPTPLPVVPIPLQDPDPDVPLDLQAVLNTIYDEAAYDLSLDYDQPPPPPAFSSSDAEWLQTQLSTS